VLIAEGDNRSKVNSQDYVKTCDYIVIFAADSDASIDAGFISQNIYLYCASEGLANVVHGTLNKPEILKALKLPASKHLMLGHSVGIPK
jgi:nitroreductase